MSIPADKAAGDVIRSSEWNLILAALRFIYPAIAEPTSAYPATLSDFLILCDDTGGSFNVTLPAATNAGKMFLVVKKNSSANTVTVITTGADTIEGQTHVALVAQYDKTLLVADGSSTWLQVEEGIIASIT
jgi:hypothetical protein